jgi:hypothetical protein
MEVKRRHVDVVEQLGVVLHALATAEEDNDLLLEVFPEEAEQEQEPLVRIADDVTLFEVVGRRRFALGVDVNVQRSGTKRHAGEVGDLGRLSRREEHRLPVLCESRWRQSVSLQKETMVGPLERTLRQDVDDLPHLVFEPDFENPVGLVNDQSAQVREDKSLRVLWQANDVRIGFARRDDPADEPASGRAIVPEWR